MRHGDAVKLATAYGQRPLSEKGSREAGAAGVFLSMTGEAPDVIMHSAQLRSRMTAEQVMAALGADDILQKRGDLEEDSSAEGFISSVVSEFGGTDKKILAVGHNPFVSRLAQLLTGLETSMIEEFKTGALLAVDSVAHGRAWTMRFYMQPKVLMKFYDSLIKRL
jgi:phosphohistidine phosphatase SixA